MKNILLAVFFFNYLFSSGQQTVGLFTDTAGSLDGYVLFAPIKSDTTYLIDKCGKRIHQWYSNRKPGLSVYLLPDGSLLKTGALSNATFRGNGDAGGQLEKYDWNGNLTWSYTISSDSETQNHDIYPLPNGNVLVAIWEAFSPAQALAAGRKPSITGSSIWSAKIEELQPVGSDSANIVWQWRLWDHLIQDVDSTKANYGVVADHPELLNINFYQNADSTNPDWIHLNALTYNPALNQVMLSAHNLSEIYIIDHSTSSAQAAAHTGGNHGKGGDFLYRWGNPQAYNRGTAANRKLYLQHNPTWIPSGYPDANNIMIFNNGQGRPGGNSSSVDIIAQPVDTAGNYSITAGQVFGPASSYWSYAAPVPSGFYSNVMGSAQRLANGNTIICEATKGHFFEIDSNMNTVWSYVNPVDSSGILSQGQTDASNQVFRCVFNDPGYGAFTGKTLIPGDPIEANPLAYNCNMLTTGITNNMQHTGTINVTNPFAGQLFIRPDFDIQNSTITLMDVEGRIIALWNGISVRSQNSLELNTPSSLASGIYILNIQTQSNNIAVKVVHQNVF